MSTNHGRSGLAVAGRLLTAFLCVAVLGACDLDSVLEVEIPGKVSEDDLNNPDLAPTLVRSVVGDVECAWNQYVAGAAIHSDEYIPTSGNLTMRNWGQRKIRADDGGFAQGTCGGWGFPMYTPLHTARFQAADMARRLEEFENVPNRTELLATVKTYGGFPLIAFGEGFCSVAIDGGPELQPAEVLALAETRFSEALQLAEQAGNAELVNTALVGRARARLGLENFGDAIADAQKVPAGFAKMATRGDAEGRRWNYYYERMNATTGFRQHGSISPDFRGLGIAADGMPVSSGGTPDPRVNAMTNGELAADFATIHWFHDKYTVRGDPLPLATWEEAVLITAEAAARSGDLGLARSSINALRDAAGLPRVTRSLSQQEMIGLVIEERRRELFVEGGHRLRDMLVWRGTQHEIPFLGEPGSIHPNGLDQTGAEYGDTTCFPLPLVERNGNENI